MRWPAPDRVAPSAPGKGASGKGASAAALPALAAEADAVAARLPTLLLEARRVAAAVMPGVHGERRAGPGEAFWDYREPQPGEGLRQIDWRRSARSDRLFVREREREVPARLHLWADLRPSMDWRGQPQGPTKAERGFVIALALGLALRRAGEVVLPAGALRPPVSDSALALALWQAGGGPPRFDRPGQALAVTDGLEPAGTWDDRARAASGARCGLAVVLVCDPVEEAFPFQGRVRFEAPGASTTGAPPVVLGRAQSAQGAYAAVRAAHFTAVRAGLEGAGAVVLDHRTDQPATPLVQALGVRLAGLAASAGRAA
jgi:uncharacterized protein (DUF58 family)